MLARIKSLHRRLSWKRGYRHGKARKDYSRPWWALEDIYETAYRKGSGNRSADETTDCCETETQKAAPTPAE
jgi:hypothetical protein